MLFLLVALYWFGVALFGLAAAEAVLGHWGWAAAAFGGLAAVLLLRIYLSPVLRRGDVFDRSVARLTLRLAQEGSREDAEALRREAHGVLADLPTFRSHRIRMQILSFLAVADIFLYRETGEIIFADEAEWALLAAMRLPKAQVIRLTRWAILARLIELYDLRYRTTLDQEYAAKLDNAWRRVRPRGGVFRSYGIGLVALQLFRESGDTEHAVQADRYLHQAFERANRRARLALFAWLINFDIMRLKTLCDAKEGKELSEESVAGMIKPVFGWMEMLGKGADLVSWLMQPVVEYAPKRRIWRRALGSAAGQRTTKSLRAQLGPGVRSRLAEIERIQVMLADREEASEGEFDHLCAICGALLEDIQDYGPLTAWLRMVVQASLGFASSALYFQTRQERYFSQADQALQGALEAIDRDTEPRMLGRLLSTRGALSAARYAQTQDAGYADTADNVLRQALSLISRNQSPQEWVELQLQLAMLQALIYGATRDGLHAQKSQDLLDATLTEAAPASLHWTLIQLINGYLNSQRHFYLREQAKDPDEISMKFGQRAEAAFLAMLKTGRLESAKHLWPLAQLGMSTLYIEYAEHERHVEADYLTKAETALREALSASDKDNAASAGIWGLAQQGLGVVYRERYREGGEESHMESAERYLTAAISSLREAAPDASDARFGRRVAAEVDLAKLYTLAASKRELPGDQAVALLESAGKDAHVLPFSMKAHVLATLGDSRGARGEWTGAHEAYEEGLTDLAAQFTSARTATERLQLMGDYSRLYSLAALALVRLDRPLDAFARLDQGHARVLAEAIRARQSAGNKSGHERSSMARRMAFRNEQLFRKATSQPSGDNISMARQEWQVAMLRDRMMEYYEAASLAFMVAAAMWHSVFTRLENLYHRRRLRSASEKPMLAETNMILSSINRLTELAEEVAELEWVAGDQLSFTGAAAGAVQQMLRLLPQDQAQPEADIEVPPGPDPSPGTAAISLLLTPQDAHAMVLRGGNVDVVPLPDFNGAVLHKLAMGVQDQPYEWIVSLKEAYERAGGDPGRPFGRMPVMPDKAARGVLDALASTLGSLGVSWFPAQDLMQLTRLFAHGAARATADQVWRETVRTTVDLLRQSIWAPIIESGALADGISSVLLIPSGPAVALPIHAAAPGELSVAYTPSLHIWRQCASRAGASAHDSIFMAAPTAGSLPYSDLAEQWVTRYYRDPTVRQGRAATPEAFCFDSMNHAVIHFHGHAYFRPSAPMRSALVCADGEVTLTDIRQFMDMSASRLVVLGACSGGQTDLRGTGDEFVGLPAGFLQVGAPAVLASMWPVPEASTAFLLDRFHSLWQAGNEDVSIARALADATRWLRQASKAELLLHLAHSNIAPELRRAIMNLIETIAPGISQDRADPPTGTSPVPARLSISAAEALRDHPDDPPFAHPVYWAGFAAYGAAVS